MSNFKIFAVTGKPILHSKSPYIFNSEFEKTNTNAIYLRLMADSAEEVVFLTKEMGINGLNITAPFKEDILNLIDYPDKHAQKIGAVNTIVNKEGKLYGTNTDFAGVVNSLKEKTNIKGKTAVVLGAGGAAKAAVYGLILEGAKVTVINRTYEKGQKLANYFNIQCEKLENLDKVLKNADILVSTTTKTPDFLKKEMLFSKLVILDANYKNSELISFAKEQGCTTIDGLKWLLNQAVDGYKFMVLKEPDKLAMENGIVNLKQNQFKNISLCGYMASGKTLIGQALSNITGLKFVDTDKEIEKEQNKTVAEIFKENGENFFRKLEWEKIFKLLKNEKQLIALGGGAVVNKEVAKAVKENSLSIWLYSSINATVKRVTDGTRPLLQGDNLKEKAKKMLENRKKYYATSSHLIFNTTNATRFNLETYASKLAYEITSFENTKHLNINSITVYNSKIKGTVNAPTSKSFTQRAIAIATLTKGKTVIHNVTFCDDVLAAIDVAKALGSQVKIIENKVEITTNSLNINKTVLNCKESGLSLRMFCAIASLFDKEFTITGQGSLIKRPVSMVEKPLKQLGVKVVSNEGLLPLKVQGPIKGGVLEVDGSKSSQFLTGLLLALPKAKDNSKIIVNNLKSTPYIDLTLNLMNKAGIKVINKQYKEFLIEGNQTYKPLNIKAEGDWSGASMLLVMGAVSGEITVKNIDTNSTQGDKEILSAIKMSSAKVVVKDNEVYVANNGILKPFKFNATDCPDLFPPLVALASNCNGISEIYGVHRLKHKESDRGKVLMSEFAKLNIKIDIINDTMFVYGGEISGGEVFSHNDHRIAMALAIAALNAKEKVVINNKSCISKSYPEFFKHLQMLGGKLDE